MENLINEFNNVYSEDNQDLFYTLCSGMDYDDVLCDYSEYPYLIAYIKTMFADDIEAKRIEFLEANNYDPSERDEEAFTLGLARELENSIKKISINYLNIFQK